MSERTFSTGEILKRVNLTLESFKIMRWEEIITPVKGTGIGQGNHSRWNLITAIAVGVVAELKNSERGCQLPYAKAVVQGFEELGAERLAKRIKAGSTHFVGIQKVGCPARNFVILDGPKFPDLVDVKTIYETFAQE